MHHLVLAGQNLLKNFYVKKWLFSPISLFVSLFSLSVFLTPFFTVLLFEKLSLYTQLLSISPPYNIISFTLSLSIHI